MERPDEATIKRLRESARDRLHTQLDHIKDSYDANKPSFEARATANEYWYTGTMSLTSLIINTGIKISGLETKDYPEVLRFKGSSWGLGIGFGTSFGTGTFIYKPRDLDGMEVNIQLAFIVVTGGLIQTSFWDGGQLIGAMDFLGAGAGAGVFWGEGKFVPDK